MNKFSLSFADGIGQVYGKHPACIALVCFSIGFFSAGDIYYTILFSVLLTMVNHRVKFVFWWGILLFFAGLYSVKLENKKEVYWEELNNSKGFSELYFEWDEDAKSIDNELKGWAWISPMHKGMPYHQYKIRKWVVAYSDENLPLYAKYKFTSWTSHIANSSSVDKRSYKCIIDTKAIHTSSFARFRSKIQMHCLKIWTESFSPPSSALLCSLVFGNRQFLSPKAKNNFMRLGLLPLLALSGMHVGIIFMCFRFLFKQIFRVENVYNACALMAVIFYGFLGGMGYSLKRAILMCIIFSISRLLGKRYNLFNALCFLALVEIVLYPDIIHSLAFQLSYLGVAGIAWAFKVQTIFRKSTFKKQNRIKGYLLDAYIVSWGAMLFTWPISVICFKTIPILSWVLSIPMTIVFSLVIFNVIFVFILTLFFSLLPGFLTLPLSLYNQSIDLFSNLQSWIIVWDNVNITFAWVYYLGLVMMAFSTSKYNKLRLLKLKTLNKIKFSEVHS